MAAETLLPGAWGSWAASLLGEKYVNGYNTKFPLLLYHIMNLIQSTSEQFIEHIGVAFI